MLDPTSRGSDVEHGDGDDHGGGTTTSVATAKELTVSAAVTSGPTGLAAPASQTLTITDPTKRQPTVTLKLDPTSISEDGGESTVTATLDRATSADGVKTVEHRGLSTPPPRS